MIQVTIRCNKVKPTLGLTRVIQILNPKARGRIPSRELITLPGVVRVNRKPLAGPRPIQ
jgi:hypothetical protein